jgi:hypothetical protein
VRHLGDDGALDQALGDDVRLLLRRPLAPKLNARVTSMRCSRAGVATSLES